MLFTYHYPDNHKLGELNAHLLSFFDKIRSSRRNSAFTLSNYFDDDFIDILNRSPKLLNKFRLFFETFRGLSKVNKERFYVLAQKSQNIKGFFSDTTLGCKDIQREAIEDIVGNDSLRNLLVHLFTVTLKADVWDIKGHYKLIYDQMPTKVCPFCGVEKMHQTFTEDYDHLAAKRHYPLAAIHPENLAPMCPTCNSKNKGEKDIFHDNLGHRRTIAYPYSEFVDLTINYENSVIPQTDRNNAVGSWLININPDNEITRNWNDIFGIKKRYRDDYVSSCYEEWLNEFLDGLIYARITINNIQEIENQMQSWAENLEKNKFSNANLIKAPLFRFFSNCKINIFLETLLFRYNQKAA